ncbi:MAG: prepilin-type N-terminal cleavage/methylation domain-containing protein [Candidatus Cloacimonetes bacterium]|nr:prepilin-type N-terminal cleavage/methylation domain-containing protein [Candidatus Cloacimonadota bacterium]
MKWIRDKKALSLIEVLVSSVILSIVLATYSSSTQGKQRILMQMKNLGVYQQLALSELEKIMNFIGSQERMETTFASKTALTVDADPLVRFRNFTKIFSQEGRSGELDEDKWSGAATGPLPRIDLLQPQIFGLAGAANYSDVAGTAAQDNVYLGFPYPKELREKSIYNVAPTVVSPTAGTFHNITPLLRELSYRDILPLVSEEYLTISDGTVGDDIDDRYDQIGFDSSGVQAKSDVSLSTGLNLFASGAAISADGADGVNSWNNELIRRFVYYRKIREGNLVFSNAVRGKADTWSGLDANDDAVDKTTRGDKFSKLKSTDVDMLYIQHLDDWTEANGSSTDGAITGIKGTAFKDKIGGVGTHSIMVMIVVREADPEYAAGVTTIDDTSFVENSTIKSVAQGIVSPSFGKNLLWTLDLSYHRYQWSRIPGIRQRLLQYEVGDTMQ